MHAREAWRGASGHGLLYLRVEDGSVEEDRRAVLEPGESLEAASEERLAELWRDAAPLTVTERRFRAPDGRWWLAQSVGPVWSEEGGAAGLSELLFTSLEGAAERFAVPDGHAGRLDQEELAAAWRRGRPVVE